MQQEPANPFNLPPQSTPDQPPGAVFEVRKALPAHVKTYLENLNAQIDALYAKYKVANSKELVKAVKLTDTTEAYDDLERFLELYRAGKESIKTQRVPEIFTIMENEREKLRDFFRRDIEVPPLPEGITVEQVKAWEAQHLKLHYLPPIDMAKESDLEHWIKPDFNNIDECYLPKDAMLLPGCWLLVDERPKPSNEADHQMYENDDNFLGPILHELRDKGLIQDYHYPQSRFNISPQELEHAKVLATIAKVYNLKPNQISLPRMIEFNVLGNIHHPEWSKPPSDCSEWFSDQYIAGLGRLLGGSSSNGGLADVGWNNPNDRHGDIGFRVLGRFS